MTSITLNTEWLQVGGAALAAGLLLGALITWAVMRRRQQRLETTIKSQEALQSERDVAFEAAKSQLTSAFNELANQSLRSNSENFLRLARETLGKHHATAQAGLLEREKAVRCSSSRSRTH